MINKKQITLHKMLKYVRIVAYALISVSIFSSCGEQNEKVNESVVVEAEPEVPEPICKYGINIDSLDTKEGTVLRNENLSIILSRLGVSGAQIHRLELASKPVFDIRKMRPGHGFTAMITQDSTQKLHYFIYEESPSDYIVFGFKDSLFVYRGQKAIRIEESSGSGIITGSLWNSMRDAGMNPIIAMELSDIYAWTVDFFGLNKGDSFKIVYEDSYVDTTRIGLERVKYALFVHGGDSIYAIPFEQDSTTAFFDRDGSSLRKAFLKAPLRFSRISSRFSHSRFHPVLKIFRAHHGIDYAAPVGTPVMTIGDGTVIAKEYSGGAGYYVKIRHNSVYTTSYLHLSKFGKNIKMGARVHQGDVIGYVGKTGLSTGPHLDFRVYKNGVPINPLSVESPPVNPISPENTDAFCRYRDSLVTILHNIE